MSNSIENGGREPGLSGTSGSLLLSWLERRRDEELKKQTTCHASAMANHGAKAKAYAEALDYVRHHGTVTLSIRLEREDDIPAFGAFCRCEEQHDDSPVILLNVQGIMSPELDAEGETIRQSVEDRTRLLITTLMHEFGHALESYFRLPVNEEHMEAACEAWDRAYDGANTPLSNSGAGEPNDET